MAFGLPGYNTSPINYGGKDMIYFFPRESWNQVLSLTATTDVTYASPMQVSTAPVMSGSTLSDHVQKQPRNINISGVVVVEYNSPFTQLFSPSSTVEDFIATTEDYRDQKRVLRVMSKDGIQLDSAFITQFEAKRDVGIANGLRINITFQEILFIEQLHKTTVEGTGNASDTANGKNAGNQRTTKNKAVTTMKDAGQTTTRETQNQHLCSGLDGAVSERGFSGISTVSLGKYQRCHENAQNTSKGKIYSDINTGARRSSAYQTLGGNPTKPVRK